MGAGHFVRGLAIAQALSIGHEVELLAGGPVPGILSGSAGVSVTQLPPVLPRNHHGSEYVERESSLEFYDGVEMDIESTLDSRREILLAKVSDWKPDVFLVEFFPLGRLVFYRELIPAMRRVREYGGILGSSVRDITQGDIRSYLEALPPGSFKQSVLGYHDRSVSILNKEFDALLVHSDPDLIPMEMTFPRNLIGQMKVPIRYTGYVCRTGFPEDPSGEASQLAREKGFVVVSVGGGGHAGSKAALHGNSLIATAIQAWNELLEEKRTGGRAIVIFIGTAMNSGDVDELRKLCNGEDFDVRMATPDFITWLRHADLSISRAGYNTCVELLHAGTPTILLPRGAVPGQPSGANLDQPSRARVLARKGLAISLPPESQNVAELKKAIIQGLVKKRCHKDVATGGAQQTRRILEQMYFKEKDRPIDPGIPGVTS